MGIGFAGDLPLALAFAKGMNFLGTQQGCGKHGGDQKADQEDVKQLSAVIEEGNEKDEQGDEGDVDGLGSGDPILASSGELLANPDGGVLQQGCLLGGNTVGVEVGEGALNNGRYSIPIGQIRQRHIHLQLAGQPRRIQPDFPLPRHCAVRLWRFQGDAYRQFSLFVHRCFHLLPQIVGKRCPVKIKGVASEGNGRRVVKAARHRLPLRHVGSTRQKAQWVAAGGKHIGEIIYFLPFPRANATIGSCAFDAHRQCVARFRATGTPEGHFQRLGRLVDLPFDKELIGNRLFAGVFQAGGKVARLLIAGAKIVNAAVFGGLPCLLDGLGSTLWQVCFSSDNESLPNKGNKKGYNECKN